MPFAEGAFTNVWGVLVGGCLFGWLIWAIIKTMGAEVQYADVSRAVVCG